MLVFTGDDVTAQHEWPRLLRRRKMSENNNDNFGAALNTSSWSAQLPRATTPELLSRADAAICPLLADCSLTRGQQV